MEDTFGESIHQTKPDSHVVLPCDMKNFILQSFQRDPEQKNDPENTPTLSIVIC